MGENNKFYYDEKLKRWVEEGADPPAEEPALAPPPTFSTFQNGTPDNNVHATPKTESFMTTSSGPDKQSPITSDQSPGMPPIPPSSNQFSARGKMGIRSRYTIIVILPQSETTISLHQRLFVSISYNSLTIK